VFCNLAADWTAIVRDLGQGRLQARIRLAADIIQQWLPYQQRLPTAASSGCRQQSGFVTVGKMSYYCMSVVRLLVAFTYCGSWCP
jgi:hypothetical protein